MKLKDRNQSIEKFGLNSSGKVLLVLGGSGGAGSINKVVADSLKNLVEQGIQIIWQTGRYYYDDYKILNSNYVKVMPFIDNISEAYSSADLVIARAGATTIAEVSYLGLPVIFVPSTNVAANHQYMNALALCEANAAVMIEDKKLQNEFYYKVKEIIFDENKILELKKNISAFARPEAAKVIAERSIKLAESF